MLEITTENAADEILSQAQIILEKALIAGNVETPEARGLMTYLILKDVWSQLTKQIGLTPDDLREEADSLDDENEKEDDN